MHLGSRLAIPVALAGLMALPLRAQTSVALQTDPATPGQTVTNPVGGAQEWEIDFLTSYYSQDGNHSAVTGGEGTEEMTVISPVLVVRWKMSDLWTINADIGLDSITSASIDNMDVPFKVRALEDDGRNPDGTSSASRQDERAYSTITATRTLGLQNLSIGGGFSSEYDYLSFSAGVGWSGDFAQKNTTLAASAWYYDDTVDLYDIHGFKQGTDGRQTSALSATLTQVLGRSTVALLDFSASLQSGFLSSPFQEVILASTPTFPLGNHVAERLPDSRDRYAIGARLNHAFTDRIVQKAYYRYYDDDWGVSSNTVELETHFQLPTQTEMWIFPILRFHEQRGSDYFGLPGEFTGQEEFFTADWDLGEFNSRKLGLGWKTIWGRRGGPLQVDRLEIRLTDYSRDDGLDALTTSFAFGWTY